MLVKEILKFWFGDKSDKDFGEPKFFWFSSTPEIDSNIKNKYEGYHLKAKAGDLDSYMSSAEDTLALIILLDQFPRNMYRGTPQAFAADYKALEVAKFAVAQGYDQQLLTFQQPFMYLPFMHSEGLADQNKCVELFEAMGETMNLKYAYGHRDLIMRFGRFPHRNKILNRDSTPEEILFLEENPTGY